MNQLPLGEKLVPQPRKTRYKISLLTFYAGKKWPSYALQFSVCFFGINWFFQSILVHMLHWVFNPARKKRNSTQCPPPALIIAPPFLIEWLLAQGLIGSFKSHACPLVIYFCRRLPIAQRRVDSRGGARAGSLPPPDVWVLSTQELTRSAGCSNHFISQLESFIRVELAMRGEDRKGK